MNIIWFSWKDIKHPLAGGAEVVSDEIRKRLVKDGHNVVLITSKPNNLKSDETIDGIKVIRAGSKYTVYLKAYKIFKKQYLDWPDIIIDEMNTVPFFTPFYSLKQTKSYLLTYQLARNVWFHQMMFPFSLIGYLLEPLYLRLLSNKYQHVLTESNSTKLDLSKYGFNKKDTSVFRIGMSMKPINSIKYKKCNNSIIFLGSFRKMKRTIDAIRAFEYAKSTNSGIKLTIVGNSSGKYGQKVLKHIENSDYKKDINYVGKVSQDLKKEFLQKSNIILVTSIKEGWGLIVTEANSQGTPAIAYDVDGLRDSVKNGVTGILVKQGDYKAMGYAINNLLGDSIKINSYTLNGWEDSKQYTFSNSYLDFKQILNLK